MMHSNLSIKNISYQTAQLAGLLTISVITPILFHAVGLSGSTFLPIFILPLLSSFWLRPWQTLSLALLSPLVSSLVTGMPAGPVMLMLTLELGVMAMMLSGRKSSLPWMAISLLAGRLSSIMLVLIGSMPLTMWWSLHLAGLPGLGLLLIMGGLLVYAKHR